MELKKQNNNVIWALVTLVVVIAAVAVAGMLLLGHDDESIQGQMEASEYRVSSKVPGRILHFYVKEGDHVRAGDTLVVLEAPDVAAKLSQAEAAGQAAQAIKEKADRGTVAGGIRDVAKGESRSGHRREVLSSGRPFVRRRSDERAEA